MNHDFKNKIAIVTGGSSGIGLATATAFAMSGARVIIGDVQEKLGQAAVQQINKRDGKAHFFKCDVGLEEDIKSMIKHVVDDFGNIDIAFNNAGIEGSPGDTISCTNENWDRTMNVNLRSVWWCMKYEIPEMLRNGGGAIVNCSSIAGVTGFPGVPAYTASKHGVIGLTKAAALEFATKNIRINAVCPGVIQTPMIDRFTHGEAQAMRTLIDGEPLGRLGKPEEIASAVLWLCSDGASFVTGHPLVVDGGWVAR